MLGVKKYFIRTIAARAAFVLLVSAVLMVSAHARTLSYSTSRPPADTHFAKTIDWWADQIKTRTNGSLEVKIYYMGGLVKLSDAAEAVSAGVADIAYISPAYSPAMLPLWYLENTRTGSSDQYVVTEAFRRVREHFPALKREEKAANMHYITHVSNGPQVLLSNTRPYITPADFEGDKVRMPGSLAASAREANWDVSSVSLSFGDIYSAMGRGTIDGAMTYVPLIESYKHNEVGKYVVEPNLGQNSNVIMMNLDTWNSLLKEQQQVIEGLQRELTRRLAKANIKDEDEARTALQDHPKNPLKFYEITDEQRQIWAEGKIFGEEEMLERMSRFAPEARELHEAYMHEIQDVAQEVAQKGYPWENE